jgi:hypothetical protein
MRSAQLSAQTTSIQLKGSLEDMDICDQQMFRNPKQEAEACFIAGHV